VAGYRRCERTSDLTSKLRAIALPDDEHVAWVRDEWERIRPFSTGSNYVNFPVGRGRQRQDHRCLQRELRAPRRDQPHLRPGHLVPRKPQHPSGLTDTPPPADGKKEAMITKEQEQTRTAQDGRPVTAALAAAGIAGPVFFVVVALVQGRLRSSDTSEGPGVLTFPTSHHAFRTFRAPSPYPTLPRVSSLIPSQITRRTRR
jgi:hypothetical protein